MKYLLSVSLALIAGLLLAVAISCGHPSGGGCSDETDEDPGDDTAGDDSADDDTFDDDMADDDLADDDIFDDDTADDDGLDDDQGDDDIFDDDVADDDAADDDATPDDDTVDDDTTPDDDTIDDDTVDDDTGDDDTAPPEMVTGYPGRVIWADDPDGEVFPESLIAGGKIVIAAVGAADPEPVGLAVGPEGGWRACPGCPLPSAPRGALIGRYTASESDWFLVGAYFEDPAPAAGDLQLAVNDDQYEGNHGWFWVILIAGSGELAPPPSDANGVFVSPDGEDANPGTMAEPMRTLTAAIAAAEPAGKAVFVAEGAYPESIETSVSLFGGYDAQDWTRDPGSYNSEIGPDGDAGIWVAEGARVAIEGFTIHGGEDLEFTYAVRVHKAEATLVSNMIVGGTGWDWSYGVETYQGVLTLRDNVIYGDEEAGDANESTGVMVHETPAIILHNWIAGSMGRVVSTSGAKVWGSPATIIDSFLIGGFGQTAFSNGLTASSGYPGQAVLTLKGNEIYGGSNGSECYGARLALISTPVIVGNEIFGSDGECTWAAGLDLEDGLDALVVNNFIQGAAVAADTTKGILIFPQFRVQQVLVQNNTINGGAGTSGGQSVGVTVMGGNLVRVILAGNIIDGGQCGKSAGVPGSAALSAGGSGRRIDLFNNDMWGAQQDCLARIGSTCITDLAELNACGWSSCEAAADNLSADPQFVNPGQFDYHISSTSPCVDTGIDPALWYTGTLLDFDFEGDPRPAGAGWDIGMDEYWIED